MMRTPVNTQRIEARDLGKIRQRMHERYRIDYVVSCRLAAVEPWYIRGIYYCVYHVRM